MWLLTCLLHSILLHPFSPSFACSFTPSLSSPLLLRTPSFVLSSLSLSLFHYSLSPLPSALFLIYSHPHYTPLTLTVTPALTTHTLTLAHYPHPYHAHPFPCSLTARHCPPLTQTPPTSLPTIHTNFLYPRSFGPQERGSDHGAQEVEGRVCMEQREHQANVDACRDIESQKCFFGGEGDL